MLSNNLLDTQHVATIHLKINLVNRLKVNFNTRYIHTQLASEKCRNAATSMPGMTLRVSGPFQINLCGETSDYNVAVWEF